MSDSKSGDDSGSDWFGGSDDDDIKHTFYFDESLTHISLTIESNKPITFNEYKQIIYDFIQNCDANGKDLFLGDDGVTLLN